LGDSYRIIEIVEARWLLLGIPFPAPFQNTKKFLQSVQMSSFLCPWRGKTLY